MALGYSDVEMGQDHCTHGVETAKDPCMGGVETGQDHCKVMVSVLLQLGCYSDCGCYNGELAGYKDVEIFQLNRSSVCASCVVVRPAHKENLVSGQHQDTWTAAPYVLQEKSKCFCYSSGKVMRGKY